MPVPQFLAHVIVPRDHSVTHCAVKIDRAARVLERFVVVKSTSHRRRSYTRAKKPSRAGNGGGADGNALKLKFDDLAGAECLDVLKGRGKELFTMAVAKATTPGADGGMAVVPGGFVVVLSLQRKGGEVVLRFDTDEASHTFAGVVNHIASNSGVGRGWLPERATFALSKHKDAGQPLAEAMVSLDEAAAFARDARGQTRERYPAGTLQAFAAMPGHHASEHAHKHRGFGGDDDQARLHAITFLDRNHCILPRSFAIAADEFAIAFGFFENDRRAPRARSCSSRRSRCRSRSTSPRRPTR